MRHRCTTCSFGYEGDTGAVDKSDVKFIVLTIVGIIGMSVGLLGIITIHIRNRHVRRRILLRHVKCDDDDADEESTEES